VVPTAAAARLHEKIMETAAEGMTQAVSVAVQYALTTCVRPARSTRTSLPNCAVRHHLLTAGFQRVRWLEGGARTVHDVCRKGDGHCRLRRRSEHLDPTDRFVCHEVVATYIRRTAGKLE
jgi:hypothetical protein